MSAELGQITGILCLLLACSHCAEDPTTTPMSSDPDLRLLQVEQRLKHRLFSNYDRTVKPLGKIGSSTVVKVDLTMKQILELNMRQEYIKMIVYVRFYWYDQRLRWNPAEEYNITKIRVFADSVWQPDIVIINLAMESNFFEYLPPASYTIISSNGDIYLSRPALLTTTCPIDITYFPFDTQTCNIQFESWAHTADLMDILPRSPEANINQFFPHGELDLTSARASRVRKKSISGVWPGVTYHLVFSRRPLYFITNFIIPCSLIEMITLMIFVLPAEGGEKISVGVSLILGLSVLLLVLQDSTPVNSKVLPLVSLYFIKSIALTVGNIVCTVIVTNIHFKGDHGGELPKIFRWIINDVLSYVVCKRKMVNSRKRQRKSRQSKTMIAYGQHDQGTTQNSTTPLIEPTAVRLIERKLPDHDAPQPRTKPYEHMNGASGERHRGGGEGRLVELLVEIRNRIQDINDATAARDDNVMIYRHMAAILDKVFLYIFTIVSFALNVALSFRILNRI